MRSPVCTVMEVAAEMSMPDGTLRHWLEYEKIKPVKKEGRRLFWDRAEVEDVIQRYWGNYRPRQAVPWLPVRADALQVAADQLWQKYEESKARGIEHAEMLAQRKEQLDAELARTRKIHSAFMALQELINAE